MNYFRAYCIVVSSYIEWGLGLFIVIEWFYLCLFTRGVYFSFGLKRRGEGRNWK